MAFINTKSKGSVKERRAQKAHEEVREETAHLNFMGGPSYKIGDPIFNLRLAASSTFFGEPQYYHRDEDDKRPGRRGIGIHAPHSLSTKDVKKLRDMLNAIDPQEWRGMSPAEMMTSAIDKALDHDVRATLTEALRLRCEEHIRTTPQVIMVRAANHANAKGTGILKEFDRIISRPDELAVQLAYQIEAFGRKGIPNSLKKVWRKRLESFTEYQLAKYRMESRDTKLVDVVNLVHPASDACSKLAKGELSVEDQTWEAIVSKNGSNAKAWEKAIEVMGHMAILRNLRNFLDNGVAPKLFVDKLKETAKDGKQLPFRYYSAYNALGASKNAAAVLDAVEECLEISMANLPHFNGRVMSLVDNSGSAWGAATSSMGTMHIAQIGNLTGVLTARASDEGYVGVFGDTLANVDVRKKASIFDTVKAVDKIGQGVGGGTENGIWLFWRDAIKQKQHWDSVFVYSDLQCGHGGLYGSNPEDYKNYVWNKSSFGEKYIDVPQLIIEYRNKVNPKVNVFLVQIAGYNDVIVPEFYDRTYILSGWGEGLLRFAHNMSNIQ